MVAEHFRGEGRQASHGLRPYRTDSFTPFQKILSHTQFFIEASPGPEESISSVHLGLWLLYISEPTGAVQKLNHKGDDFMVVKRKVRCWLQEALATAFSPCNIPVQTFALLGFASLNFPCANDKHLESNHWRGITKAMLCYHLHHKTMEWEAQVKSLHYRSQVAREYFVI